MSEAPNVTLLTADEVSLYRRFNEEEQIVATSLGKITMEGMIQTLQDQCWALECSARAAAATYGGSFDAGVLARIIRIRSAATLLERIAEHGEEVGAILRGQPKPQYRRRA